CAWTGRRRSRRWARCGAGSRFGGPCPPLTEPGGPSPPGSSLRLEPLDHGQPELRCAGAVEDAVVERDRDRADGPDRDLAVADDRAVGDAAAAEDRDLRVVDERR